MSRKEFWTGISVGAGIGVAAVLIPQLWGKSRHARVVRLEKSIQIGSSVEEVFHAWSDFDHLPRVSEQICSIRNYGNRSHWRVNIGGRDIEWDAITEQYIPNQSIGWKSVSGPKHTGRITFSPLKNDTLVHVTMNYAPPSRILRPFVAAVDDQLEDVIEKVLRDFKASIESRSRSGLESASLRYQSNLSGPGTQVRERARTGTFDSEPQKVEPRFGGTVNPVDYTSPPDAKR
jgi:uncharacterized membrane protein